MAKKDEKKNAIQLAMVYIERYFRCMLKSTEFNPCFYSPSLTETTDDSDGGQVVRFGDSNQDVPKGVIYKPKKSFELCDKYAYVCFDDAVVKDGAPRYISVSQYETLVSKAKSIKPTVDASTSIQPD